jgi:hypothetical protein
MNGVNCARAATKLTSNTNALGPRAEILMRREASRTPSADKAKSLFACNILPVLLLKEAWTR